MHGDIVRTPRICIIDALTYARERHSARLVCAQSRSYRPPAHRTVRRSTGLARITRDTVAGRRRACLRIAVTRRAASPSNDANSTLNAVARDVTVIRRNLSSSLRLATRSELDAFVLEGVPTCWRELYASRLRHSFRRCIAATIRRCSPRLVDPSMDISSVQGVPLGFLFECKSLVLRTLYRSGLRATWRYFVSLLSCMGRYTDVE